MSEQGLKSFEQLRMERAAAKVMFTRLANRLLRTYEDMEKEDLKEAFTKVEKAAKGVYEAELGTGGKAVVAKQQKAELTKAVRDCEAKLTEVSNLVKEALWSNSGRREVLVSLQVAESACQHATAVDFSGKAYAFLLAHLQDLVKSAKEVHSHWRKWIPSDLRTDLYDRLEVLNCEIPKLEARKDNLTEGKLREEHLEPTQRAQRDCPMATTQLPDAAEEQTEAQEKRPGSSAKVLDQHGTPEASTEPEEAEAVPLQEAEVPAVGKAHMAKVEASEEPDLAKAGKEQEVAKEEPGSNAVANRARPLKGRAAKECLPEEAKTKPRKDHELWTGSAQSGREETREELEKKLGAKGGTKGLLNPTGNDDCNRPDLGYNPGEGRAQVGTEVEFSKRKEKKLHGQYPLQEQIRPQTPELLARGTFSGQNRALDRPKWEEVPWMGSPSNGDRRDTLASLVMGKRPAIPNRTKTAVQSRKDCRFGLLRSRAKPILPPGERKKRHQGGSKHFGHKGKFYKTGWIDRGGPGISNTWLFIFLPTGPALPKKKKGRRQMS